MSAIKNMMLILFLFFPASWLEPAQAQTTKPVAANQIADRVSPDKEKWEFISLPTKASLRGLHVLDDRHILASGTGGTFIRSSDRGQRWQVQTVAGAHDLDFRDVHAIDPQQIVLISSGTPARIYRSSDAGQTWKQVFQEQDPKYFLDAIAFWDNKNGVVMGDPIDGRLFLLRTQDGGNTWQPVKDTPPLLPGEAGFAASGTNTITVGTDELWVALGGAPENKTHPDSRILVSKDRGKSWDTVHVPLARSSTSGVFSLWSATGRQVIAVGGDFQKSDASAGTIAVTDDHGRNWLLPTGIQRPSGYRSCVASIDGKYCLAVGPNGTDRSTDRGRSWSRLSADGFHAVGFSPTGTTAWATGSDGRVARLLITKE